MTVWTLCDITTASYLMIQLLSVLSDVTSNLPCIADPGGKFSKRASLKNAASVIMKHIAKIA